MAQRDECGRFPYGMIRIPSGRRPGLQANISIPRPSRRCLHVDVRGKYSSNEQVETDSISFTVPISHVVVAERRVRGLD